MSMEIAAREVLETGNIQEFEEFLLNNSENINIQYSFEEGLTFPMVLVQIYRKAESLLIDRSKKVVIEDYKHCLNFLFENGCPLDAQDSLGRTVSHWTILLHCLELLATVLGLGCNPIIQDCEGETIVHLSIRYNDQMALETIKLYANNPDVFESPSETSGATPLIYAVQIGAVDILRKLLQLNVKIDAQENNKYKRTALHYALFTDNEEIFTLLLKNKAKSDIKDYKDKSVIDRVAEHPKDNFLRIITHYSSSEIFSSSSNNSTNPIGYSPVIIACKNSDYQMLCDLIDKETERNGKLSLLVDDSESRSPLHHCAENPDTKCAEKLIEIEPKLINRKDRNGFTVLHLATIANNLKLVSILIKSGCNTREQDNDGHTCLHWAVVCCAIDLIDLLFKTDPEIITTIDNHGASALHYATQSFLSPEGSIQGPIVVEKLLKNNKNDVNFIDYDNRTPLLWAASLGITDCCQILLEHGANINHRDVNGLSVLHCAASRGHYDVIDLLVNTWSMPVDIEDNNLCTPLFYAVTLKHMSIIHFLIEQRSNPNQQDIKGRSVAHCAALKGYCDILDLIRKNGGSLTLRNNNGDLPLHEAAETGKLDVCELLLDKMDEANEIELINDFNKRGLTPLHKAAQNNHHKICKLLISRGAIVNILSKPSEDISKENCKSNLTPLDLASGSITIDLIKDFNGKKSSEINADLQINNGQNNPIIETISKSIVHEQKTVPKTLDIKPIDGKRSDSFNKLKINSAGSDKTSVSNQKTTESQRPKSSRQPKFNERSTKNQKNKKVINSIDKNFENNKQNQKPIKEKSERVKSTENVSNTNNDNLETSKSVSLQTKFDKIPSEQNGIILSKNNESEIKELDKNSNSVQSLSKENNLNNIDSKENNVEQENSERFAFDKYENKSNENQQIEEIIRINLKSMKPVKQNSSKSLIIDKQENTSIPNISTRPQHQKELKSIKYKAKSAKDKSANEVLENGIEIKAISYNSLSQESNHTTSSSLSSYNSYSRKPQKSKSTELSLRVVESVREYENIRDRVKSITEQRKMELFQGYSKTLKLNKMISRKSLKSAKPKKISDNNSNNIELPEVTFQHNQKVHNLQTQKKQPLFPSPISKADQIRSAYDCGSVNSLTLY